jgi:hypothetical protein
MRRIRGGKGQRKSRPYPDVRKCILINPAEKNPSQKMQQ